MAEHKEPTFRLAIELVHEEMTNLRGKILSAEPDSGLYRMYIAQRFIVTNLYAKMLTLEQAHARYISRVCGEIK